MILYEPIDSQAYTTPIRYRPRTCFLMTQLGDPVPDEALEIRSGLNQVLEEHQIELIDANDEVTGKDFLFKIWRMVVAVPLAVAILHEDMPTTTQCNVFYEIGLAQALGKETIVLKTKEAKVPSDFVRTEYVEHNAHFEQKMVKYIRSFFQQGEHYEFVADQVERNPLLALDYLRRAYLISGDNNIKDKAAEIHDTLALQERAKNSVETLLVAF